MSNPRHGLTAARDLAQGITAMAAPAEVPTTTHELA